VLRRKPSREETMGERTIYITDFDLKRLRTLLNGTLSWDEKEKDYLTRLEEELEWAEVVSPEEILSDVVTMNSQAQVRDLNSNEEMVLTLVFPDEADYSQGRLSILAPIGTALLGYRAGDTVEWRVPAGIRRLKVEQVLYQPEAAGDYHL
jgi:regulator of nucleoside diphosphate kinase